MKKLLRKSLSWRISIRLVPILVVFWVIVFAMILEKHRSSIMEQLHSEAKSIYEFISLTRLWISSYGGIYIEKGSNMQLVTPSHFVKELTEFSKGRTNYVVKMAVLNSADPNHYPDEFEKEAIERIEKGEKEFWRVERRGEEFIFRYAGPLKLSSACRNCHWEIKSPYGCISVSIPATSAFSELKKGSIYMATYLVAMVLLLFASMNLVLRKLIFRPLKELSDAATRIAEGDLSARVRIKTGDEMEKLGSTFNYMADRLMSGKAELEKRVREATQELKKAYEYRSEFFSNVTHDLKTPIVAIKGAAQLMERKGEGGKYTEIIRRNAEKLLSMVENLLNYSKLEAGERRVEAKEVDLVEVLEDVIFTTAPIATEKGIKVSFTHPEEAVVIKGDRDMLFQLFMNLVSNAIKFSKDGDVEVSVERGSASLKVAVKDRGPGIPKEELQNVFEKFYKKDGDGMGLGLAICKKIVEAHKGKIWAQEREGGGTVFYVKLPL